MSKEWRIRSASCASFPRSGSKNQSLSSGSLSTRTNALVRKRSRAYGTAHSLTSTSTQRGKRRRKDQLLPKKNIERQGQVDISPTRLIFVSVVPMRAFTIQPCLSVPKVPCLARRLHLLCARRLTTWELALLLTLRSWRKNSTQQSSTLTTWLLKPPTISPGTYWCHVAPNTCHLHDLSWLKRGRAQPKMHIKLVVI